MAAKKKKKPKHWMAIITHETDSGPVPIVLMEENLEDISCFESPESIEELQCLHILGNCPWSAFNFTTGEVVVF